MNKALFILFLATFNTFYIIAQLSDSAFIKSLKDEDILIISEYASISFVGEKALFINIVVEKDIEYRILNDKGVEFFQPYILPQPFDEVYQPHNSKIRNANKLFDEMEVNKFEASVTKSKSGSILYKPENKIKEVNIVNDEGAFGVMYQYTFLFSELKVGDTVKIKYKYQFPFKTNWQRILSMRVFLNTAYPRQYYNLSWSFPKTLIVDTNFINNSRPELQIENNRIIFNWNLKNLPGCIDEIGSQPANDLPWFSFSPKPYELIYEQFNSFEQEFVPLWYILSLFREGSIVSAVTDNEIGAKDKDNLLLDKIAKKFNNMAPNDTNGIARLRYFQRWMADSVKYNNGFGYFNKDESYLREHPGAELYSGIVKEHNKEFVYASLIPKMANEFFTAYIVDRRQGTIGAEYFAPMYDNDLLFAAILGNNTLAYLIPKSDRNNYYCEELPFYYEDTKTFLMYTYDFAGYKRNFNEAIRLINTPGSILKDNYRKTNSMAKINISENNISFTTKISLSGQYSTLTRFDYLNYPVDSTINPLYHRKVWEIGHTQTDIDYKVDPPHFYYPFKTGITANYSVSGIISSENDLITIDLSGWIKHVIFTHFISGNRFTDFYPDFPGYDSYVYLLDFDQPISLVFKPEDITIENNFAKYTFNIQQSSENQILINSYFLIKSKMVKNSECLQVKEVYSTIEETNKAILKVSINNLK